MTYENDFDANGETINQKPLAENIQEQADLSTNEPKRQKLKLMLIGSPEAVESAIYHFHLTGHAEIGEWSPLQECPNNPEEKMSILVRYITVE